MKKVLLVQPGVLQFKQAEEPGNPGPDQTLVRVKNIGVCGTDLHAYQGTQPFFTYPRVLGHELSVEVIASGEGEVTYAPGTRCAVEPYFSCGYCSVCRRGKPNCCLNIQVFGVHIDGGMCEFACIPTRYLHPSSSLSFEQLALVEPLAIGAHAVTRAHLDKGEHVLVIGAGPIGLAVAQSALLAGAQVLVLDISEQRLAYCKQQWPQIICLDGRDKPLAALQQLFGDDLPTAVFDATGNSQSMRTAFSYVGHGGRLIFVGLFQGDITFNDPDFHKRELTLLSSRNATATNFRQIITHLEGGQIDVTSWITHRASAQTVPNLFPHWFDHDSGIIKAVVAF
jgi:2-desacetyl-2-hydroxyethyl bacteriochlorophyllide A dehydrogenase